MGRYIGLSRELEERILENQRAHWESPYRCRNEAVIRKDMEHDHSTVIRPPFVRDCEKVMYNPFFNRYADKTQVFSLYKNDDITRRLLHVQLVSRIARNIGRILGLNVDLIEAIALGHDIGHTPFGHAGEYKLNELYQARTGRMFHHNLQSVRVLHQIFPVNISLQTLDGILCHNGELELQEYTPMQPVTFAEFETVLEECYTNPGQSESLRPHTLEGCVVRVADMIAYLGKDRQDAIRLGMLQDDSVFYDFGCGTTNAELIHNISANLIENSYGKPYLRLEDSYFEALSKGKEENFEWIYGEASTHNPVFSEKIYPMFEVIYERLLREWKEGSKDSLIYRHHISYVNQYTGYYPKRVEYESEDADAIVVDFISAMTDDYLVDLYDYWYPNGKYKVEYKGYF